MQARDAVILSVSFLGMIALAAAGLWIGVAGVALVFVWTLCQNYFAWTRAARFDRFRQRFREVLSVASLSEDKEFLQKHADSILYPLAVAEQKSRFYPFAANASYESRGRENVGAGDLEHVEMLYQEHCASIHDHLSPQVCKLCASAVRVRAHIEDTLSKIEGEVAAARSELVSRIDAYSAP